LALYCVDGLVFYQGIAFSSGRAPGNARRYRALSGRLATSEAGAVAALLHLFDFPEHPHEGSAKTDDETQKQEGHGRGCEHGEHPSREANGVNSEAAETAAIGGILY
jgi:hypothetical protein